MIMPSSPFVPLVGLPELFLAVLVAGLSSINLALPLSAWRRSDEPRFLAVGAANGALVVLGILWTWGELPLDAPGWTGAALPTIGLVAVVSGLILLSTLLPPRS